MPRFSITNAYNTPSLTANLPTSGGASGWLGAGGGGGGYQWGSGRFLPGGNDPWGNNHSNPYPGGGGTGYGSDNLLSYLEKMAIILDQMVREIGTSSSHGILKSSAL